MRTWPKGTARAALLTAGFVALGAGVVFPAGAYADTTNGQSSVLGGNQVNLPISAPIDASGNALAVAGHANSQSKGGAGVMNGGGGQQTSGQNSVGGGNQVNAPISAPVNACGMAIAIFGTADAGCKGGASVKNSGAGGGQKTSGKHSVLGGNQVNAPISAPVNVCGNAVAIFGTADAGCDGGAKVKNSGGGAGTTDGESGVAGGNQVNAPISAPVNVCGNAAALLGDAVAGCDGGAKVVNTGGGSGGQQTSGKNGVIAGNQVNAPISAPVSACGNAVGNAPAGCDGGASVHNDGTTGNQTSGESGVIAGNQVHAPIGAPVAACGNAVALLGNAGAECQGGAKVTNAGGGAGDTTSGKYGVASGNQVFAPVTAPVNVCGNAVAVLGDASAGCVGTAAAGSSGAGGDTTSGQSGAGSGNQVTAPVKAPVDTCGNVVTVGGQVDPSCGNGASAGGVVTTSRDHQDAPVGLGLPVLSGLTEALPMSPGSALPTLPVEPPVAHPMSAPEGTPLSGLTGGLPVVSGLTGTTPPPHLTTLPAKPRKPKKTAARPGVKKVVKKTTKTTAKATVTKTIKKRHQALPVPAPAGLGGLTDLPGALPVQLPLGQLPTGDPMALTPQNSRSAQRPADPAPTLPDLKTLPVAGALPVSEHVNAPQVGGVTDQASGVTDQASGVTDQVGSVTDQAGSLTGQTKGVTGRLAPMAAVAPAGGTHGSSLYVLTVGALFGAASVMMAAARRLRRTAK